MTTSQESPLFAEQSPVVGTTGTGLDAWVSVIVQDPGLNHRVPLEDISGGAEAADGINHIIVDAIKATGVANDGTLNAADLYDVNRFIRSDADLHARFIDLHGDDEGGDEWGFHLVQNDGATTTLYARNAVNTVFDGAYHIGFEIKNGRFLNEDGNNNQDVEDVAYWLSDALADDLASGALANPDVNPYAEGTTSTSLDRVIDIIRDDIGLNRSIGTYEITEGAEAADGINHMIVEAIQSLGLANDGVITASDVYDINSWFQADADRYAEFVELHGDDEGDREWGYHSVQNDGGQARIFGDDNAMNTVFDGLYHIGFDIERGRFENEDGNANASVTSVAHWLDQLLRPTLEAGDLVNDAADPFAGVELTGTGLDLLIGTMINDEGLNRNVATSEIAEAAEAASEMNAIIVDAIEATGAANDGAISTLDLRAMNAWIQENRYDDWVELHGDDDGGEEWGFHLVQNDGDTSYLFDRPAMDTVADGIYHMGFDINRDRFENEDGNSNASLKTVSGWLNAILAEDLADGSLVNEDLLPSAADQAAIAAAEVLDPVDESFDGTGLGTDLGHSADFELANGTIALTFIAEDLGGRKALFSKDARGTDEPGHLTAWAKESGIEVRFQDTDGQVVLRSKDFPIETGKAYDIAFSFGDDGAALYVNGVLVDAEPDFKVDLTGNTETLVVGANAYARSDSNPNWRADRFDGEIKDFTLYNRALEAKEVGAIRNSTGDGPSEPIYTAEEPIQAELSGVVGTTGTGLDGWVSVIVQDPGLNHRLPLEDISGGAEAADGINQIIVDAIKATGVANDGTLNAADLYDVNRFIQSDADLHARFIDLHGDDEGGDEWGFHLVQNDGATTTLYARNAVNTVFDGAYHIGFDIKNGRFLNEDGNNNQDVEDVAYWLSDALADDLASGALANAAVNPYAEGTTGTSLDQVIDIIRDDIGLNRSIGTYEITEGAEAADGINHMIVDAIESLGLANDGVITASDVYDINSWFQADADRYAEFVELHGDDEGDREWGYHSVQNDGGQARIFGDDNAMNTVFDGLYHIGFDIERGRFENEDGNANASVTSVAHWLDQLLRPTLEAGDLVNDAADPFVGVELTGTGLDLLIDTMINDEGLNRNVATSEIAEAAEAASEMNAIIVDAIEATGAANDGTISTLDLRAMNAWIQENRYDDWVELHGDDDGGEEWGFHLVQNDGDTSYLFDRPAMDTVADGIYHMGFDINRDRFENEDGNSNASLKTVSGWLNAILAEDLSDGSLVNEDLIPDADTLDSLFGEAVIARRLDSFDGTADSQVEIAHSDALALANGTIVFDFTADAVDGKRTLFSKDFTNYQNGGHLTAYVKNGEVEVRFQSDSQSIYLDVDDVRIEAGETHSFAFSFGEDGAKLYFDGQLADAALDFTTDLTLNTNSLVLGASTTRRGEWNPDHRADPFDGEIDGFTIFGRGLTPTEIAQLHYAPEGYEPPNAVPDAVGDGPFHVIGGDSIDIPVDTLLANDIDPNGDALTLISVGDAQGGSVELLGDLVRFTADAIGGGASFAYTIDDGFGGVSDNVVTLDVRALPDGVPNPVFMLNPPSLVVDGAGDQVEIAHSDAFELGNGTVALTFVADSPDDWSRDTLFSKDASGYGDGGHLTAYVRHNDLILRFQGTDRQVELKAKDAIEEGVAYDTAFTFGDGGAKLYLNGSLVDDAPEFNFDLATNTESLAVGANTWSRQAGTTGSFRDHFDGTIEDFAVFDQALSQSEQDLWFG